MPALPPYRLQTLLELRERAKEAAEQKLQEANAALKREEAKLAALENELKDMAARRENYRREYMEKAMRGEVAAQSAVNVNQYVEFIKGLEKLKLEEIADQRFVIEDHKRRVEVARQHLVAATQALKALEKHKEKWLEAIKRERAMKEEETMDELAQNIFLRSRGEG